MPRDSKRRVLISLLVRKYTHTDMKKSDMINVALFPVFHYLMFSYLHHSVINFGAAYEYRYVILPTWYGLKLFFKLEVFISNSGTILSVHDMQHVLYSQCNWLEWLLNKGCWKCRTKAGRRTWAMCQSSRLVQVKVWHFSGNRSRQRRFSKS